MKKWRIYYGDGSIVEGNTKEEWVKAPDDDVQVVMVEGPPPEPKCDRMVTGRVGCPRTDYTFYTGVDKYDPLNYGHIKYGKLLDDDTYWKIWNLAYGNNNS